MAGDPVLLEERDDVAVVLFNRPDKLNAMNKAMWEKLSDTINKACNAYQGIVLTGKGRAFSAGDDIKAMYELRGEDEAERFFATVAQAMESIAYCRKPVVAALNGLAAGGGAEMLLLTDYVIASREAWISYPEILIGLIPPVLLALGPDLIGLKATRRLALSGDRITAEEARRIGIIDEIVDEREKLLETAIEKTLELSSKPKTAYASIKRLLYERYRERLGAGVSELARLVVGEEAKKLMRHFLETRASRARP